MLVIPERRRSGEPGTHDHRPGLWVPGSRLSRARSPRPPRRGRRPAHPPHLRPTRPTPTLTPRHRRRTGAVRRTDPRDVHAPSPRGVLNAVGRGGARPAAHRPRQCRRGIVIERNRRTRNRARSQSPWTKDSARLTADALAALASPTKPPPCAPARPTPFLKRRHRSGTGAIRRNRPAGSARPLSPRRSSRRGERVGVRGRGHARALRYPAATAKIGPSRRCSHLPLTPTLSPS